MQNALVQRETLTALVGTYQKAVADVESAYRLLEATKKSLQKVFGYDHFHVSRRESYGQTSPEETTQIIEGIKRQAWRVIVDRLELRRILSIKRRAELDSQLADGRDAKALPEITEANILAMFQDGMAKSVDYAREAVFEVFDWLRPQVGATAKLKTNNKWQIGKKVIIGGAVEPWHRGKFRTNYYHQANITALDNVFHMLDGRGALKTHYGPLHDAIEQSDGQGETEFFKFRCCLNGNLHIEFLRPDLVTKINQMAGRNRLRG